MMNDWANFKGFRTAREREAVYAIEVCRTLSAKEKVWLVKELSSQ